MAYLKLWIDPNIISESQIQLPDKVVVGKNEDGSDKHNLVTTKYNVDHDDGEDHASFLLDPDPKYLQMPVWYAETKDNLDKSYLYVDTHFFGYANYWTFYIASKLRIGIDTDDYGTYLRLGCKGNIKAEDEITKISTTYNTLVDGSKDYYLLPACAEGNHKRGGYYRTPPGSTIFSVYTKDNSKNIGKTDALLVIDTGTYTSKHVATNYNLGIGCAVLLIDRITFAEGVTEVDLPIGNDPNDNPGTFKLCKADGYYYFKVWIRGLGFFKSEPLQDFDITIPHTYIFISSSYPSSTVEVWVDGKQYKKEDGTDFDNSYSKYNKFSFSIGWEDFNTHNIYEFRLIQGEEPGDLEYPLKAYITASRNPVIFNKPSLSTSKLTCHVDGVLDRDSDKYKKYLEHDWGEVDFSVFPPRLLYADGDILAPAVSDLQLYDGGGEHVTLNGDDCLKVTGWINFPRYYSNPLYKRTPISNIQVEFDYKYEVMSSDNGYYKNPTVSIYTLPYYTGGYFNSRGIHLHYVASVNKYVICVMNLSLSGAMSDYLDIDFTQWHTFKLVIVDLAQTNKSIVKVYIDNTYIPFHDNDYGQVSGTDIIAYPSYDATYNAFYNYWHYAFNSYANFYEGQVIWYKNYRIKTLTLNTDYEEYPELTYLWDTGETTRQITVQPTEPTTYSCTVTQGTRTANASILIDTTLERNKPIAVISPQEKPYIEHMIGRFYATNSYDINDPVSPIVKYIWNDVETISPVFVTRVKRTDKIRLRVVNALGLESDEVEVDLSKDTDQWGNKYRFLDIPMFLICSKGANLFDTLISRFPIPSSTLDLYSNFYPTEYDKYTSIGFTTDISTDTIRYMACLPHHGVAEYTANREQVDIYPLGISWLEKRNMIKYYNKVKGSKGSLMACIGHPELQEEGYSSLEFVLDALGIITPKERYTIPRLLDLLELLLMDYDNGGLIKL